MSLADELAAQPDTQEVQYVPRTEYDGTTGTIQTAGLTTPVSPDAYNSILEEFGYDPNEVQILRSPRISRWQRWDGEWLQAYRFTIGPRTTSLDDIEAIILRAQEHRSQSSGPHWFVFQAGDHQIGKRSRDGSTEEIIEKYVDSVDKARQEFKNLAWHGVEGIQISMPGDCLEGNMSQGGKNIWLTQETITEQTRILRRMMMYTLEQFAPLADRVYLDVVNGNHDEAQREQGTYPGNGWATEQAIAVADALKMNQAAYGHVEVRVPDKWSGNMTVPVGDSVVTIVHGHQWTRTQGPMRWWAEQAVNNNPAGASQILQFGHWHEYQTRSNAHRMAIGSPTFDMGSDWYREKTGASSRRGALVYLLKSGEVSRLSLV